MDLIRDPNGLSGDSTAAVRPRTDVPSPEPTLSSANSASPTDGSEHGAPTTPLHSTSFFADEVKSTHSRGDSWASFSHELLYEFPISLGMAATMQEPRAEPTAAARARKSSIPLPKSGATLDMAFFLKNTGPSSDGKTVAKDKVNLKRMGLGIFKKKKEDDGSHQKAVYNSPPHDRAEPKVTLQGTPYLQIVPHPSPFKIEGLNVSTSPDLLGPNSPHHLSAPSHEDNPDAYGTETIDNWISTFTTPNQEDGLESPTSKGISILYNTPSNSSKRNSYMIPAGTLPWLAEDGDFKLTVDSARQDEEKHQEESQLPLAVGSNPSSSPKEHKRSISIPIPGYDRQITCTFENDSLAQLIEAASESSKDKIDRRTAELMNGQGSQKPVVDAEQAAAISSSSVKKSKALPFLPSEAIESANNNNLTTGSMLQMWRQRDAAAASSSVKVTYVPRSRRTTMIKSFHGSENLDDELESYARADAQRDPTPPSSTRSSQVQASAKSTPTTNRNSMTLSQVMLVAEQMPIPRGRHVHKPAPLLLRGRHGGKAKTIAVRESDMDFDHASVQMAIPNPVLDSSPATDESKKSTGDAPVLLRPIKLKEPQRAAPRAPSPAPRAPLPAPIRSRARASSSQPTGVLTLSRTPPGVPPRSSARLNPATETVEAGPTNQPIQDPTTLPFPASSQDPFLPFPKRRSSLLSKSRNEYAFTQTQPPSHTNSPPQSTTSTATTTTPHIITKQLHPPPPRQTTSRASNHSAPSSSSNNNKKSEKLGAEMEALRRENKLLEAALMAVLKTGGTLNKCPCGFLGDRSQRGVSPGPSGSAGLRLPRGRGREGNMEGKGEGNTERKGERMREGEREKVKSKKKGKKVLEGGKGSLDLGRLGEVSDDLFGAREEEGVQDGYLSVTAVDGSRASSNSSRGVLGVAARTGSVASFESGGSGVSALEVYLGTRV